MNKASMDNLDMTDYDVIETVETSGDSVPVEAGGETSTDRNEKGGSGDSVTVGECSEMGGDPVVQSLVQQDTIQEGEGVTTTPLSPADEPYVGQEFESEQAAHAFYSGYASRVGFGIRKTNMHRSRRDNSRIGQQLVCNKEGFKSPEKRTKIIRKRKETRVGCKAMVLLRRNADSGKWLLTRMVKEHNHPLNPQGKRKDGLDDHFPSEHDKSREVAEQLLEERKTSKYHKRDLESLCDAFEEYHDRMSKKIKEVLDNVKELEVEEEDRKSKA